MQADTDAGAFEVAPLPDWERLMDFYGDDEMLSCDHPATRHAVLLYSRYMHYTSTAQKRML